MNFKLPLDWMAQKKKAKIDGDLSEFILLVLLKEGPLSLAQLQERTALQRVNFHGFNKPPSKSSRKEHNIEETCDGLVCKNWLNLTDNQKYELTKQGKIKAEEFEATMEKGAVLIQNQFLNPTATARNTTAVYIFLSIIKLFAGFMSGSVGLIADGADTTVDTTASGIVWFGIKFKKEILGTITIIVLMFLTAVILFRDSIMSVIENVRGVFVPMSMPYIVIVVELVAMLTMFVVSVYQRFVGKRSQSLALISQSVDSKNSVYSSAAVIIGALFSVFGVYWVDAIVGGFIAVRISLDGIDLSKEVEKLLKGKKPEFSRYKMPFEKQIGERRMDNFRHWIMYSIKEGQMSTEKEIVDSLDQVFRPTYMPAVFSEFIVGKEFDFKSNFSDIVKPLLDEAFLIHDNGVYSLSDKGKTYIRSTVSTQKYKQTEL